MKKKYLLIGTIVFALGVLIGTTAMVLAGTMDSPGAPSNSNSQMYTLDQVYDRLDTGLPQNKMASFTEPGDGPGSTGRTLDQVYTTIGENCITCEGTIYNYGVGGTRWCDNLDGTVTDMTTGLVWLQDASWGGAKLWRSNVACTWPDVSCYDDAHRRAGMLSSATNGDLSDGSVEGDWRLPTQTELWGLRNGTEPVTSGNPLAFTGVQSGHYWSSRTYEDNIESALGVNMSSGSGFVNYKWEDYNYVWPVRGPN